MGSWRLYSQLIECNRYHALVAVCKHGFSIRQGMATLLRVLALKQTTLQQRPIASRIIVSANLREMYSRVSWIYSCTVPSEWILGTETPGNTISKAKSSSLDDRALYFSVSNQHFTQRYVSKQKYSSIERCFGCTGKQTLILCLRVQHEQNKRQPPLTALVKIDEFRILRWECGFLGVHRKEVFG